jgi:hypothetical protein
MGWLTLRFNDGTSSPLFRLQNGIPGDADQDTNLEAAKFSELSALPACWLVPQGGAVVRQV